MIINTYMANFAQEINNVFGYGCSVKDKDWNKPRYFDYTNDCYAAEAALAASLTSEAYNMFGLKCQYFVKKVDLQRDELFGEDPLENIERRFELQIYAENIPTMQKQYDLQGMIYAEVITCQCTIQAFNEASRYNYDSGEIEFESTVPKIGDIIWMEYSQMYYEVINVKKFAENSTFLSSPITYTFSLRVWRNSHETVDASNVNSDKMEDLRSFVELGETFNIDTKTETHDQTYIDSHKSDQLSINTDIEKDVDEKGKPKDNVEKHVEYKRKIPLIQQTEIDPFEGW